MRELISLYMSDELTINNIMIKDFDHKFHRDLDICNQSTSIKNLYLYIFMNLLQSRKGFVEAQTIELTPECISGARSNYYAAIKFFIEHKVIAKIDRSSNYLVNPRFINKMSKTQECAFQEMCMSHQYDNISLRLNN
jgi:hypothetical protein